MLSFFRRVSKSKIGTGIMALVLFAILAGFAVADISNFGSGNIGFGGMGTVSNDIRGCGRVEEAAWRGAVGVVDAPKKPRGAGRQLSPEQAATFWRFANLGELRLARLLTDLLGLNGSLDVAIPPR